MAGTGLVKAADAWFSALQTSNIFSSNPVKPARLGTEPQDLMLDGNGNITTPLAAGSQYIWYSGNGGRIDLNSPAGYGPNMPSGITDPLVLIQANQGNYTLGGLVLPAVINPTTPTTPTTPSGTGSLAFQIVSYDSNSGVLQYKFTSSDNSPVNVTLPGIFGGIMNPNTLANYTFSGDARQGRNMTGYATQSGNQANINFTNGCNMPTGAGRTGIVESQEPTPGTELTLSVQPNPNNGQFEVRLQVPESKPYVVGVTDLLGRILWKSEGVATASKFVKSIDLQGWFTGSAVVYLQSEGKRVSQIVLIKP